MSWWLYLNYKVYKFYKRKHGRVPVFSAFLATLMLACLNVYTLTCIGYFLNRRVKQLFSARNAIILVASLALLNYLLFYAGNRYKEVFNDIDIELADYSIWNRSIRIYIITSIVLSFVVLVIADQINQRTINI